jgi:hypothetical protein
MSDVVVGLDIHLKNTQVTVLRNDLIVEMVKRERLRYEVLLANPVKVKLRAEDIKNDKVDSKTLAELVMMNWLPTCYVPPAELRS